MFMKNWNKIDFDRSKKKKEKERGFGKIDSSVRVRKPSRSKPLFQGRFIRTPQRTNNITTNIFLSNFSKLASLFQKKIYFSILLFSCPLHVYSSTNKLKKKTDKQNRRRYNCDLRFPQKKEKGEKKSIGIFRTDVRAETF